MADRFQNWTSVAAMMARKATPAEAMMIEKELLGLWIVKGPRLSPPPQPEDEHE